MRFATPSSSAPVGRWRNGARPITPPSRLRWKGRRSCWWKGSREERTEIRGQRSEDRGQKSEDRRQKTEDRRQKTEDRRQKTEDRRQKTAQCVSVFTPKELYSTAQGRPRRGRTLGYPSTTTH